MNIKKTLLLTLLLAAFSLPLSAQINDTYVVPAAAYATGAFRSNWMTQLSLFNPHTDHDLVVSITFLPTGGARGSEVLVDVPRNSVTLFDNVLREAFDTSGTGSLLVATFPEDNPGVPNDVLSRSFLVTSSTYNNLSSGTYGQTISGTWTGLQDIDTDEISAVAHGIRNNISQGWRTNIGAVNLGRCSVTMYVTVYDIDGNTKLNRAAFNIPPLGHFQDRLPIEVDRGSIEFYVEDPCANDADRAAVVFPYVSTIDQLSGDPTYQQPTLLASARTLYGKSAVDTQALANNAGKRISNATARAVRATAVRKSFIRETAR